MSRNGEEETRKEHAQRDDYCTSEDICERLIYVFSLESDKSREYCQWRRQNVAHGNGVDEHALGELSAYEDGFDLNEWYCSICPTKGQTPCDQAKDE